MILADPTARDEILEAIEATLKLLASEVEVEPNGDPSTFPALHIFDGGHKVLERDAGSTRYAMMVEVAGYVEGDGGPAPTRARNALQAGVVASLINDPALAVMVELIDDDDLNVFTAALAERRRLAFSQFFTIQFSTLRADPSRHA